MNKCRGLGMVSIFEKEKSFVWVKDFSFFKNSNFLKKEKRFLGQLQVRSLCKICIRSPLPFWHPRHKVWLCWQKHTIPGQLKKRVN